MEKLIIKFNPFKDFQISEEARLIIHDWKAEKLHKAVVIPPMGETSFSEQDFEPHLYYRYKYQVIEEGKWTDKTRYQNLPERKTKDGIKYLYYHQPNSKYLIVVFQALASTPGYNYVRTLKDLPVSKLYIKDEYGPLPTKASYYLGEKKNLWIAEKTSNLIEEIRQYNKIEKKQVICAGSSKGGFASIFQAYLNGYGYAIAGGPQIYLGDYLGKSLGNPKSVLAPIYTYITGSETEDEKHWANQILTGLVQRRSGRFKPELYIHVGKGEPHYKNHVLPFYTFLEEIGNKKISLDLGDYDDHDELAKYFPVFLKGTVEKIINNSSTVLFKRTEPNQETIKIADSALNNEIFLFKTWEPFKFDKDLTWEEDPYKDKSWVFYLHELRMVSFLVNAYEITSDSKYLEKARWYIESWYSKNPNPNKNNSEWSWSGHNTANRLINLLYFWVHYTTLNNVDKNFKKMLSMLLIEHGRFLAHDDNYEDYNHGIFQDQALLELSVLGPTNDESKEWEKKSLSRLLGRIKKDFSKEGIHKEHSPAYHLLVMKLFINIKKFMNHYSLAYSSEFNEKFIQMQDYLAWIVREDGTFPLLGDTGLSKALTGLKEEDIVSDYWLYRYSKGRMGKPLEENYKVFHEAGIALFKGETVSGMDMEWIFTAAFHSTVHKHADDLAFLLRLNKTDYFIDGGRYNYKEKDPFRRYLRSALAHNTIAVDGKTYKITIEQVGKAGIFDTGQTDNIAYVKGIHELYDGVKISRRLLQLNKGSILIHDKIISNEFHKYTQVFNLGNDVEITQRDKNILVLSSKVDESEITLKQIRSIHHTSIFEGEEKPIRGWQSYHFNEKHKIKSVNFDVEGVNGEFLTLININGLEAISGIETKRDGSNTIYYIESDAGRTYKIKINEEGSFLMHEQTFTIPIFKSVEFLSDEELVPVGASITAKIDAEGQNLSYAWYIYHNDERIDFKRYSPELKNLTINFDQEGIYFLKAFVRDEKGFKESKATRKIKVINKPTEPKENKKSILSQYKQVNIDGDNLHSVNIEQGEPVIVTVQKQNTKYDFLIRKNNESPFLCVFGSGAYNSKEYRPPVFQRHSWINEIDSNVIFYNDPTLYLGEINLGWGQGTNEVFYLKEISEMIKTFAQVIGINHKNILFYGSSAGGFMSLVLGGFIKGSSVLVNNPQTIVSNYFKSHVRAMYEKSYPNLNEEEILKNYGTRLDVISFYKSIKYMPNVYYLQNGACQHDMGNHFQPFIANQQELLKEQDSGQLIVHLYWDEQEQHNPVSKEETLSVIKRAKDLFLPGT